MSMMHRTIKIEAIRLVEPITVQDIINAAATLAQNAGPNEKITTVDDHDSSTGKDYLEIHTVPQGW